MENFIKDLDEHYKAERKRNKVRNENFCIFVPMKVNLYGCENINFLIRKGKFTKFLYIRNGCRVYFSDADILEMLLQVRNRDIISRFVESLTKVYRGEGEIFLINVEGKQYEVMGIPEIHDNQNFSNPQDITISFEDLFVLINLILAKDMASIPLWPASQPDFLKHTCAKYISLLKFYYYGDFNARDYLNRIGYDTKEDIYFNYKDAVRRDEKHNLFYDFNLFEKAGIL